MYNLIIKKPLCFYGFIYESTTKRYNAAITSLNSSRPEIYNSLYIKDLVTTLNSELHYVTFEIKRCFLASLEKAKSGFLDCIHY